MAKIVKAAKKAKKQVTVKKTSKQAVKEKKTKEEKFVAHKTGLQAGDKAPDFNGLNQDGKEFSLAGYKGKKLILYFYPKDNTPTCTNEACNLQENLNSLKKEGYEIVGVSADDVKSHKKFAEKFGLKFNLLADPEMKAIRAYDVWGIKQFMGRIYDGILRTTFIIDEKGIIRNIITAVESKDHANQIRNL
ncbi:MAG: thioredoxin-dependent thiol peroxidase [Bacteroidetes bacterium]|jgi:peroxiredoxin Q/BCP|nr:thioredoxin-dependent thiol peroxidase [Bacteroidota bacterium]